MKSTPSQTTNEPSAPELTPTPVTPTTPEQDKSKKKQILIFSAIGAAVLLAIIGTVIYLTSTPSKQDYKEAATQFNTLSAANSSLSRSVSSLTSGLSNDTDEEFNAAVKGVETSTATLKEENKALGDLKALRKGEGKDLYKAFDAKLTSFVTYSNDMLTTVKKVRPVMVVCSKVAKATDDASRLATAKECSTTLSSVGDISNAQYDTYIKALKTGYADYARDFESFTAITSPFGSQYDQYKALRTKITATQKTLQNASREFATEAKKSIDEVSVKDSANTLGNFLEEQQK